nr:hypothetical protein [Tanacetum cinerariifolium]
MTIETTIEQQVAMDEALVPSAQRLRIEMSNFRLLFDIQSKGSSLQLVYDVLHRCPFFKAFLVTAGVPEIYMQEFWATTNVHHQAIRFKMDNKKHIVNLELFRDMLHICPSIPGQSFAEIPFKEEILDFIWFLGHSATIRTLTDVNINKLYQPWRSFAAIINKCLTGKSSGYDSLRLSQAQILWGLYHKRNVDYAFLMWEDFVYQVEHKNQKKSNEMYYPRFTKVIIHHSMSKDLSIPRRNKVNWHYVRDDFMFSTIKLVSRHQNMLQFGALLPIELTNEEIRNSKAYKEYYAIATGEAAPKPKASARRTRSGSDTSITPPTAAATPRPTTVATSRLTAATKGKQTAKASKAKSLSALFVVAMTEAQQLKLATRRSIQQTHISQPSSSGADEGTGADDEGKDGDDDEKDEGDDGEEGEEDDEDKDKDGDERDGDDEDHKVAKNDDKDDAKESGDDDEEGGRRMESIFATASTSVAPLPITAPTMTPSTIATITTTSQAPIPPTSVSSDVIQNLPSFGLLFRFDDRLKTLEANFSEFRQTNPFAEVISAIPEIVHQYINQQMNEAVRVAIQIQTDRLRDASQRENDKFLRTVDENMKKIIKEKVKDQVKEQVLRILPRIEQSTSRSTTGSRSQQASASKSDFTEEPVQTTSQMEEPSHPEFDIGAEDQPIVQSSQHPEWFSQPQKPPTLDCDWNKTLPTVHESIQPWISELTKQADTHSSFNELMDTPLDFSNFIMNRLRVDTLTPELLAGPTYDLMKGSGKSLIELKYHLEEVYKATTDQLDWVNPEGSVPRTMWIQEPIDYDKHALWGVSHWGRKRQQFYGFAVNRESAHDVYSKRRIIAVTDLKIVEWHSYKHLDWITLSNLTVEECFAFNVSLRMFTRSIVIQRRVEDLQLGVESYQKRLNLTKPDTYRSDLKRREAYTAYSNPQGFIYQNKDKKNRLMRIDELYKFSNGTLIDVRTALDDR